MFTKSTNATLYEKKKQAASQKSVHQKEDQNRKSHWKSKRITTLQQTPKQINVLLGDNENNTRTLSTILMSSHTPRDRVKIDKCTEMLFRRSSIQAEPVMLQMEEEDRIHENSKTAASKKVFHRNFNKMRC